MAKAPGPRVQSSVVEILFLSSRIALNVPVNNQHVLLALLLESSNPISTYLVERGIDISELVQKKFYFARRALEFCRNPQHAESVGTIKDASALLAKLFAKLAEPRPAPSPQARFAQVVPLHTIPRRPDANATCPTPTAPPRTLAGGMEPQRRPGGGFINSEQKAKKWLGELIPEQAQLYAFRRYIEIDSKLYAGRHYRIFSNALTAIYEKGKQTATCCIHLRDLSIPPTDRVIGEYFMIKGDEKSYLRIANVTRIN